MNYNNIIKIEFLVSFHIPGIIYHCNSDETDSNGMAFHCSIMKLNVICAVKSAVQYSVRKCARANHNHHNHNVLIYLFISKYQQLKKKSAAKLLI
jgi:hypothetical protein